MTPTTVVDSKDEIAIPQKFHLLQNNPNPFGMNGETAIQFELPAESTVQLEIFNLLGERVALLVDEKLAAGKHRKIWNARPIDGKRAAAGIYFYRLQAGSNLVKWTAVKKIVVLP